MVERRLSILEWGRGVNERVAVASLDRAQHFGVRPRSPVWGEAAALDCGSSNSRLGLALRRRMMRKRKGSAGEVGW